MQFKQVDNPRGNEKKIAGQKWIFAPAPLGAIERFQDQLSSASVPVAVIIDMAHICLKRNYPDITLIRQYLNIRSACPLHSFGRARGVMNYSNLKVSF